MNLPTHIPPAKAQELQKIVEYILADPFYAKKKCVAQILLFGSYARDEAVEKPDFQIQSDGTQTVFQSDYDIIVLLRGRPYMKKTSEENISRAITKDNSIQTPVSLFFETISDISEYLRDERYFYQEIVDEGITLWQRGKTDIKTMERGKISPERRKILTKEDFENHWEQLEDNILTFELLFPKERYKKASFELHQATENLLACLLLTFIRYNPKTHDLKKLLDEWIFIRLDKKIATAIQEIFPRNTEEEKYVFDLLCRAYIESRYYKNFKVTKEDLGKLLEKIEQLKELVEKTCKEQIQQS